MTTEEKTRKIVSVLTRRKAEDVQVRRVGDLTIVADYFVLATGTSNTQIKSLANEVEYELEKDGVHGRMEGKTSDWILLDYGDVICHFFLPEAREHYNLERLWADAEEVQFGE
ncbi:MAG: ribosome silencing factor [Oscillospiraceae bacterium]|nr:ribosome silencing factor [Oscillospiraceae bacterium]